MPGHNSVGSSNESGQNVQTGNETITYRVLVSRSGVLDISLLFIHMFTILNPR